LKKKNIEMKITILVPVKDEIGNIRPLLERIDVIQSQLKNIAITVLFVDDGSIDGTLDLIKNIRIEYSYVGYIQFSRNFGHQAALEAGLFEAQGDVVISMDGDLQHPPEEIPRMLKEYENGADVVQMVRANPPISIRGLFSGIFYKIFSSRYLIVQGADFRLYSARVLNVLKHIPERNKMIRALIPYLGFKQVQLKYSQEKRQSGTSSYSYGKLFSMATKYLFEFSMLPLKIVFFAGVLLSSFSFIAGIAHIITKLVHGDKIIPGFTDLIVSVLFLSGCTLLAIGILGKYLVLVLEQLQGRPTYIIKDKDI
jgi:polyisoprenyl-phosphate glycosyltransferase